MTDTKITESSILEAFPELREQDLIEAIRAETEYLLSSQTPAARKSAKAYKSAKETATELIYDWIRQGTEYMVRLSWPDLTNYVSVRHNRTGHIWAVFAGKAIAEYRNRPSGEPGYPLFSGV